MLFPVARRYIISIFGLTSAYHRYADAAHISTIRRTYTGSVTNLVHAVSSLHSKPSVPLACELASPFKYHKGDESSP